MKTLLTILVVLFSLVMTMPATAALVDADRAELLLKNLLKEKNPGFENGKASWTASGGTFTTVTSGGNFMGIGKVTGTWDSSSSDQTLTSGAYTIPNGMAGTNGVAFCKLYAASGTPTHTMGVWDGSTLTNTVTVPAVLTTAQYVYAVPFIFGAATTTIAIRFTSVSGSEPLISIDDCAIAGAEGTVLSQISQPTMYGYLKYAGTTSCQWSTGNTGGAFTDFAADTDCPAPSVANYASAPATKIPRIKFATLPPGEYQVIATGLFGMEGTGTTASAQYKLYDGTTYSGSGPIDVLSTDPLSVRHGTLVGRFTYTTTQSNIEFRPVALSSSDSNDPNIYANIATTRDLEFIVYRFPTTTETAYNTSQLPASWAGYHDSTCSWARTNTSYGDPATDASCALTEVSNRNFGTVSGSNSLPSITFTPARPGRFLVCANGQAQGATAGASNAVKLWDGTTTIGEQAWSVPVNTYWVPFSVCGIYNAATTSALTFSLQTKASSGAVTLVNNTNRGAVEWAVTALDQAFPAPLIVNSVVSNNASVYRTIAAKLNCDSSSSITSQSGTIADGVASIGNISSAVCAVTLASGTFSAAPYCNFSFSTSGTANTTIRTSVASATSVSIEAHVGSTGADATTFDGDLVCFGPK